jgi:hypothetical protein
VKQYFGDRDKMEWQSSEELAVPPAQEAVRFVFHGFHFVVNYEVGRMLRFSAFAYLAPTTLFLGPLFVAPCLHANILESRDVAEIGALQRDPLW